MEKREQLQSELEALQATFLIAKQKPQRERLKSMIEEKVRQLHQHDLRRLYEI
jgi:hypothetical protein